MAAAQTFESPIGKEVDNNINNQTINNIKFTDIYFAPRGFYNKTPYNF
jgi:hypothetical protein